jgi:probable F420-dependent oxidoreductase
VKVDGALIGHALTDVPQIAVQLETLGYDGLYTFEGPHEPFFPLLLAAEHTRRIELTTAIAIAFARTPMTLANLAWDLQQLSNGRFALGLGTQIKPHIEKRFSMPWSHPAARMRELVLALRAIFDRWQNGTPLDFRGEFYTHTLMTPMFDPGPCDQGAPRISLAGVGPGMTAVAGEVADGFMVHPFTTERFLREVTLPALVLGASRVDRSSSDIEIALPAMVAIGDSEEELAAELAGFRTRLAFYGSTPAYRIVLDTHGWGDLQPELNRLSKLGDWATMQTLITDDMLHEFVVAGSLEQIPERLIARFGGLVDRVSFAAPPASDPDRVRAAIQSLQREPNSRRR